MAKKITIGFIIFALCFSTSVALAETEARGHEEEGSTGCRVEVNTNLDGSIRFPITLKGTLKDKSSTCKEEWVFSETELGSVVVKDGTGVVVSDDLAVPLNFMAPPAYPLPFLLKLKLRLRPKTENGEIIFTDRMPIEPWENEEPHTKVIPITFAKSQPSLFFYNLKLKIKHIFQKKS